MTIRFLLWFLFIGCATQSLAQQRCGSLQYLQQALIHNPSLQTGQRDIERFIQVHLKNSGPSTSNARPAISVITIPVVVHIVYHREEENIADDAVIKQLSALNRDYRRNNADSNKTPEAFRTMAADTKIEFALARVDPDGRSTSGIERIYSPVDQWEIEGDKVKYKSRNGADGWNPEYYLNIWVCNLQDLFGYSSVLGDDPKKDGVVINYSVFNDLDDGGPYNSGRTAVHEIGHWLSLKHLWGDANCGDDYVEDTPPQATYTIGCPGAIRTSCNNSPLGDMYMNFMDYTDDPCMNLFTSGQRDRMRTLFDAGGLRNSILSSKALGLPWVLDAPLPADAPRWLYPKLYPDPAGSELTLDLKYDPRWIGQELIITNVPGQVLIRHIIHSTVETINISGLNRGIYFVHGNKDGERLAGKFIKMQN